MKPTCEIVEYASMRLRLVCAIATHVADAQRQHREHDQHVLPAGAVQRPEPFDEQAPGERERGDLGAEPMSSVTGVGAPW